MKAIHNSVTRTAITKELDSLGVRRDRGRETRYWLYPLDRQKDVHS